MIRTDWRKGGKLGAGSYGTVFLGETDHPNYPIIAVKSATYPASTWLQNEEVILRELEGCDYIIRYLGNDITLEQTENGNEFYYNMFLEYAPNGTLDDLIKNSEGGKLPEHEVMRYARMILIGLSHMHWKGYVHCDLKPSNILVFDGNHLKIADFGLSKRTGEHEPQDGILTGTPYYMSPESVTLGKREAPLDTWSVGCIVVEMFTGQPLWPSTDKSTIYSMIASCRGIPELPRDMSETGKDFLKMCFEKDCVRWTADMLLQYHPYVAENPLPLFLPICIVSPSCLCLYCSSSNYHFSTFYRDDKELKALENGDQTERISLKLEL